MSKTFCPIPWMFQAVRNNGDLRLCCQANVSAQSGILRDEQGEALNARTANLEQARNSDLMKTARLQMLKGVWPESCVRCKSEEASGLRSRRIYEGEAWSFNLEQARSVTNEKGEIDTSASPVLYYDLRFGNKCNLACRMCGPTDSSAWYDDYVELTGRHDYKDTHGRVELSQRGRSFVADPVHYNWFESEHFWNQLEQNSRQVRHIYMAGGEPLLIEQHYKFLERCIERGLSSQIIIEYNTNLTILPEKVLKLWESFKQVRVGASIDGYGEVFELQRYPARWDKVLKNLERLDQLPPNVISWLAYTVTVYNVMHLPDFMRWKVLESGFKRINSTKKRPVITHHMAHKPEHLNVRVLSVAQKQAVSQKFSEALGVFEKEFSPEQYVAARGILQGVENYMNSSSYHDKYFSEFVSFNRKLDEIRNQQSGALLPSL